MQSKNKKSVYFTPERIERLWKETKEKRNLLNQPQSQVPTKAAPSVLGVKRPATAPVHSNPPQIKKPMNNLNSYNHYHPDEVLDCLEEAGYGEGDWETAGCSHYRGGF